ncbi:MAG: hypothetical protein OEV42_17760 [Deltaproteobacteria bacterium]|nr:hypothetical protein [Deltaproteobacteria bacterium]
MLLQKIIITAIAVFALMVTVSCNTGMHMAGNKLPGYIEISFDNGIKKIALSSGNVKEIIKRKSDFSIGSFDVSPDGKKRVFATRIGRKSGLVLYSTEKDMKTVVRRKFVGYPSFSPDGNTIAYLFQKKERVRKYWFTDSYLYTVNVDGSTDKKVSETSVFYYHRPSWFPDGRRLAVGTRDFTIRIIDLDKGTEKKIIDFGSAPTVSNDGKTIAYLSKDTDEATKKKIVDYKNITYKEYKETVLDKHERDEEMWELSKLFIKNSIYLYDVSTKESRKLTEEITVEMPVVWSPDDKYLIYNDRRGISDEIFAVEIETGKRFKVTSEHGRVMVWRK